MKKRTLDLLIFSVYIIFLVIGFSCYIIISEQYAKENITDKELDFAKQYQQNPNYSLEQILILSRHNVRAPLVGKGSTLDKVTTRKWHKWDANAGELSVRGGQLETSMGQFFRKYLEYNKLIPENWIPQDGQVRFYANSLQRTIATTQFFASGMLPIANPKVEHHFNVGQADKTFIPFIQETNDEFEEQVRKEMNSLCNGEGINGLHKNLKNSYKILEQLLDYKHSEYAKTSNTKHIPIDELFVSLEEGKEPKILGNISMANIAADAIQLNFYEDCYKKTKFTALSSFIWLKEIAKINDTYLQIQNGTYTIACNQMHPMLEEIKKEFNINGRLVTFLCGHDSTLIAVLTALQVKQFCLPNSVAAKTPIGGKIVFEKYHNTNGEVFVKVWYCYNTFEQLQSCQILSLEYPPAKYELEFENLTKNKDGFYKIDDLMNRFDQAINYYYKFFPTK